MWTPRHAAQGPPTSCSWRPPPPGSSRRTAAPQRAVCMDVRPRPSPRAVRAAVSPRTVVQYFELSVFDRLSSKERVFLSRSAAQSHRSYARALATRPRERGRCPHAGCAPGLLLRVHKDETEVPAALTRRPRLRIAALDLAARRELLRVTSPREHHAPRFPRPRLRSSSLSSRPLLPFSCHSPPHIVTSPLTWRREEPAPGSLRFQMVPTVCCICH